MVPSLYDQLGGEHKLRAIIDRFVERMVGDVLIGYFFARVAKPRLKSQEYDHAAAFLGAPVTYAGRPIAKAHARHRIALGHFNRRRTLLRQVLQEHAVRPDIVAAWLAHQDSLRAAVMGEAPPT